MVIDLKELTKFFEQSPVRLRNTWVHTPQYSIYVRHALHYVNRETRNTFDIATISIDDAHQNMGYATAIIKHVESLARKRRRYVFVESVISSILEAHLLKNGYTAIQEGNHICLHYYKRPL